MWASSLTSARRTIRSSAASSTVYVAPRGITFERWADEWFASLRRPKENTKRVYRASIAYGKLAFGTKQVRKIGAADIGRLLDLVAHTSPASQRRHLRVLHGCFAVAVRRGYATRNPVAELEESAKPRASERRPAYFTDAELARLWPELAKREPVYLHLSRIALTTGCRQGELVATRWGSVRLLDRELHVDETYVQGIGLSAPKGNEGRTVDLTPAAVELLEQWFAAFGSPGDHDLVFPHPLTGGYLVGSTITRDVLYRAIERRRHPARGRAWPATELPLAPALVRADRAPERRSDGLGPAPARALDDHAHCGHLRPLGAQGREGGGREVGGGLPRVGARGRRLRAPAFGRRTTCRTPTCSRRRNRSRSRSRRSRGGVYHCLTTMPCRPFTSALATTARCVTIRAQASALLPSCRW